MTTIVFLGPTLGVELARAILPDAVFLPPVKARDVRSAMNRAPTVIGVVDGMFEQVPTVWHKELLHALSCGVWVYGSSSMGALRAAELAPYGMIGVGTVFEAFRSGELEDDDEVAVSHASEEHGFRAVTEAMVNVRATLRNALQKARISADVCDAVERAAKSLFYGDRSWPQILSAASSSGVTRADIAAVREVVARERVDQKRADAILMLERIARDLATDRGPFKPTFAFPATRYWREMEAALVAESTES